MGHLAQATIKGVNDFLAEQKKGDGAVLVSLTLFNTDFDVRYVASPINLVPDLGTRQNPYSAHGGTALYDAVATTIHGAKAWLETHRSFTGDVVTVIQTDGEENSSQTTTLDELNRLISTQTARGWEFIFQGTGQAAWTEADKFTSIPQAARFAGTADVDSYVGSYAASSRAMSRKRATGARFDDSLRTEGMQDEQQKS